MKNRSKDLRVHTGGGGGGERVWGQSFLQALLRHIDLTVFGWIKNKGDNLIRYSFIKKKTAYKENPGRRGTISLIILIILDYFFIYELKVQILVKSR